MREALEAERLEALALAKEVRARRCGRPHEARAARAAAEGFRRLAMEVRASATATASAAARSRPALEIVRPVQPDPEEAPGSA